MNPLNFGLGVCAALVYVFLGYAAQGKVFNWKKFLRSVAIGAFSALGLDLTCMTFDVCMALVGPTAITVWMWKLIDAAKPAQSETSPKWRERENRDRDDENLERGMGNKALIYVRIT